MAELAELDIPESIIQQIQSSLTRKEAAATVVLSKSWYKAWLTRPILDFDERDFPSDDHFFSYVMMCLERYKRLNLKIESFGMGMNLAAHMYSSFRATHLILEALKMGALDIMLDLNTPIGGYFLPKELFQSEEYSLVRLSVAGGKCYHRDVMCSKLKSLCSYKVDMGDDSINVHVGNNGIMIRTIILDCPSLEDVILSDCRGFNQVIVGRNMVNLKNLRVTNSFYYNIPLLIEFEDKGVVNDQPGFCRLTCLQLENVKISDVFLCDFSNKFPCVKELTLFDCRGCEKFNISSQSINYLCLENPYTLEIKLDVPNIRKFKYSGTTNIPSLCVVSASREWKSDITLNCWKNLRYQWFVKLNKFLTTLSTSNITLGIELFQVRRVARVSRLSYIQADLKPMVENLTLGVYSLMSDREAILDGIFWSIRPKTITLWLCTKNNVQTQIRLQANELVLLLRLKLTKLLSFRKRRAVGQNLQVYGTYSCGNDLQGVDAELFEDEHVEWQPLPWTTFSNTVENIEKDGQIRFRLRWRQ